ncbi:MAG: ATPase, T2SS/T4P/T4SS family [Candidatus Omnitrophota bacterium]
MPAKTIVIFSSKGGTGRTFLSVNLATSLSYHYHKKTCLVDLDLDAPGDMARSLNIIPALSAIEIASSFQARMKDSLISYPASGIDFLSVALRPTQTTYVDPESIDRIFGCLSPKYDYIIIDVGRTFSQNLVATFNHANLILLLSTPDILSVYQSKWALEILQSLHFPLRMVRVVLNRAESIGGITPQEIDAVLPCALIARIPSDGRSVGVSLNRRVPVVLDSPRSRVSLAIKKLSQSMVEDEGLFMRHIDLSLPRPGAEKKMRESQGEFLGRQGMKEQLLSSDALAGEAIVDLKRRVHSRLINELDLKRLEIDLRDAKGMEELRRKTKKAIVNALDKEIRGIISSPEARNQLIKELMDETLGLGPLEELIADPAITDIMVNNKDQIYVERFGKIERAAKKFLSNEQVRQVIERIIAPLGRRIDESVPMVDARLADGSRVNAIIPPLSLGGPMLTIRKFARERFTVKRLIELNTVDSAIAEFIRACVLMRKNIIVSGGTGSGKTTILNVLSSFIPENERIITIEDAAELKLHQEHWARLEARASNIEGKGAITIRDLFRNTLRMRPDRIIIGECRGGESLDMLQAMNTGHDGSMTTLHANSPQDVLSRLDSMILMAGAELPVRSIREMIASAIDVIIHSSRLPDGSRKIVRVSEITGMVDEMHIGIKDVFSYHQSGMDEQGKAVGDFMPTGYIPSFYEQMHIYGIHLAREIFNAKA